MPEGNLRSIGNELQTGSLFFNIIGSSLPPGYLALGSKIYIIYEYIIKWKAHWNIGDAFHLPALHADDTHHMIEGMLQLDVNRQSELQHRGWLDRLRSGRSLAILITMTLSLFTAVVGERYRMFFAWTALALFLVGFVYSIFAFRQERRTRLAKEVERIRDAIASTAHRACNEVLREWQGRVTRHFKSVVPGVDEDLVGDVEGLILHAQRVQSPADAPLRPLGRLP